MRLTASVILKMDDQEISKLSVKELKEAIRSMQKSVSQRVKRLEKAGFEDTPAARRVKREGAPHSTDKNGKPLDINGLRNELYRGKKILEMETLTITGARKMEEKWEDAWGEDWRRFDQHTRTSLWECYNIYVTVYPEDLSVYGSKRIKRTISQVMVEIPGMSEEEIVERAHTVLHKGDYDAAWDGGLYV